LVQREVALGGGQRVRADVEVRHRRCPAPRGVNRETAGKTERIQHAPAPRQRFHLAAIFALVEEETGLLPAQNVGLEAQAAFQKKSPARFGLLQAEEHLISVAPLELPVSANDWMLRLKRRTMRSHGTFSLSSASVSSSRGSHAFRARFKTVCASVRAFARRRQAPC
jgi:hypothetical protein